MADTTPPDSISGWLKQVNNDPDISAAYKNGREGQLKLSGTSLSSGLMLNSTETLLLRTIWHTYPRVECLGDMMTDNPEKTHTGYVSTETYIKASSIFNFNREMWEPYFQELKLRAADEGNIFKSLDPSKECEGLYHTMRQQLFVLHRTKDEQPTMEDLARESSIVKFGLNAAGIDTPSPANDYAKDDHHAIRALIFFLQSITLDVEGDFSAMDWLPDHLPFQLTEEVTMTDTDTQKVVTWTRELMEARVDGYLCRKASPYDEVFNKDAVAIMEVKPFTRSSARTAIRRQEAAQMACWISQSGGSNTGLLQTSTSGSKRRLMISQDRHEIFIIVAEYGAGFEKHIRPRSFVQGSVKTWQTTGEPPVSNSITQASSRAESSDTQERWVPDTGDFLTMHEFGPFLITDAGHMEMLIKQIIALMLQLRGPQARFIPEPPSMKFFFQPGLPFSTESSEHTRRILKKARSFPAMNERLTQDWVKPSEMPEWRG